MLDTIQPYSKRSIRFLELAENDGWRIKVYGISAKHEFPHKRLVEAAKKVAFERLPKPANQEGRYASANLIAHEGEDANYIIVDWWVDEVLLQHHVYTSPLNMPEQVTYFSPTGIAVCIWELHVLNFEKQAWCDAVLANPGGPDLKDYFSRRLNCEF